MQSSDLTVKSIKYLFPIYNKMQPTVCIENLVALKTNLRHLWVTEILIDDYTSD